MILGVARHTKKPANCSAASIKAKEWKARLRMILGRQKPSFFGNFLLRRQAWQDLLVDRIVAECSLIPSEAEAPQPTVNVQVQSPGLLSAPVFEKG